jgi:membrane protein DedA with SNARE-associated domain
VSEGVTAVLQFAQHDYSWLAQFFSLLVLPFAHEDLAIIFGAYVVVNNIMPVGLVALCIYGGMVISDFALYGLGVGARRLPWLARIAIDDRVRGFNDLLQRNLFGIVALCRVVPGVVFFAFVACGWTRVPLRRFAAASLLVSALYLPLMLCIAVFFGDALDERAGFWTWPLLVVVVMAMGYFRQRVFGLRGTSAQSEATQLSKDLASRDEGTPTLASLMPAWSRRLPHARPRPRATAHGRAVTRTSPSRA